jgi:hypothetical protein
MEHYMCQDYHSVNKWTRLNKYAMILPEEIFLNHKIGQKI